MTTTKRAAEMAAKQERLRAAAAGAQAAVTPPAPEAPAAGQPETVVKAVKTPRAATKPLAKDVRLTVDLSPARYRDLQGWLNDAAVQLGRSRVTKQDALAALVGLLLRDDVIARKVLAEIRDSQ